MCMQISVNLPFTHYTIGKQVIFPETGEKNKVN